MIKSRFSSRKLHALVGALVLLTGISLSAAEVDWGNSTIGNGLGLADGTLVPAGDLVRVGSFDITPTQIAANASDLSYLNSNFTEFADTTVGSGNPFGDGSTPDGYWAATSINLTTTLGIAGDQIYYWAFNASTLDAATQDGIFTDPSSANWIFPADVAIPNSTTTDLGDVPSSPSGIIVGGYGTGDANGFPEYDLEPVPEPSSLVMLGCAVAGVIVLKTRKGHLRS